MIGGEETGTEKKREKGTADRALLCLSGFKHACLLAALVLASAHLSFVSAGGRGEAKVGFLHERRRAYVRVKFSEERMERFLLCSCGT